MDTQNQSSPEVTKAAEVLRGMLSRSATDRTFRQKLLTEPRAAIAEYTGHDVPDTFDVVFVENTAAATIVLPDPVDPEAELSEAELEAVAGGSETLEWAASALYVLFTLAKCIF
jgi:hypothetical protein